MIRETLLSYSLCDSAPAQAIELTENTALSGYLAYGRPDYDYEGGDDVDAHRGSFGLRYDF